ncbi:hypothetical protein V2G26_014329 [Clonostachys chloroleuca]|uniref:Uncharacterized protein n=2 Tax=Clonostachys TaxID=110564 RepID=A0A9N9YEL5_9HYPO|nr:unnamed protein product [Clonostachys rhizophaga]CAI6095780.1 unnamed protein product [Clonostachys chloroleuca]
MSNTSMATHLLGMVLPSEIMDQIETYLLHPQSPFQTYKQVALTHAQSAYDAVYPHVEPLIERLLELVADNQGYTGLVVAVAVATAVFVVMSWVHRLMMWWTRVMARLALWGVVAALVAFMWSRGPEQTVRDVVVVISKVMGFGAAVKDIWLEEYRQYESQQRAGSASRAAQR